MIRRPLFYGVTAFTASILTVYYIGLIPALAVGVSSAAVIFAAGKARLTVPRAAVLSLAFYLVGLAAYQAYDLSRVVLPEDGGGPSELTAKVIDLKTAAAAAGSDGDTSYRITAAVSERDGKSVERAPKVLITYYPGKAGSSAAGELVPGDMIRVTGSVEPPRGKRNPGCFDYSLYLRSIGIERVVRADNVERTEASGKDSFRGMMYIFRESFLERLKSGTDEETAAMMGAIMFGVKEDLDEEVLDEFRRNGTAHILAVSGLHIGMIYGVIAWLWRWKKGRAYFAVVMAFFTCYMAMASFAVSVVRAVMMIGLHLFSKVSDKRYDMSSAAFLTALVMLAVNPMQLFNTGFQMSFIAVLSMALIMPFARRLFSGALLASVSVQAGLIPYTAYVFNYLSVSSLIVNLPIVFLAGIIVPAGLAIMAMMAPSLIHEIGMGTIAAGCAAGMPDGIYGHALTFVCKMTEGLCEMLTRLNHVTTQEGISVFTVVSPDICLLAAYYSSCVFFLSEEGRLVIMRKKRKMAAILMCAVIAVALTFGHVTDDGFGKADVIFVDVGQGDCMHFRTAGGGNYMIDGGGSINYDVGKDTLRPYLLKNGVRKLDGVFVTHLHTDHYEGVRELCDEGMVERLFLYEGNRVSEKRILEETGLAPEDITYLREGQRVILSEDMYVDVLWPEKKSAREYERMADEDGDENESSLVFKVNLRGRVVIADGDIDEACQDELAERYGNDLKCDILKAAHHGSRYSDSEAFLRRAAPEYGVFQVGRNNFGHPDKGVVENYREHGIIVYRNDENGAVGFDLTRGGGIRAITMKG